MTLPFVRRDTHESRIKALQSVIVSRNADVQAWAKANLELEVKLRNLKSEMFERVHYLETSIDARDRSISILKEQLAIAVAPKTRKKKIAV